MLDRLAGLVGKIWAIPVRSPRSLDPELIGRALPRDKTFEVAPSFERAWKRVVESGSENVLVTGSLFLAGEAIAVLNGLDVSRVGGAQ
jgi:folylpolyglutamate synthase/dihydropteroate synthase